MADPRLILGRIASVNGTSPGPSSGITYTIGVHDPNVEGVYTLNNQAPMQRWPNDLDITAVPAGTIVIGTAEANRIRWHFMEMPAFADCPSSNFAATAMRLLNNGIGNNLLPNQPSTISEGTIGSGEPSSIPGPDAGAQQ
jgi:hypothetical protein